MKLCGFEAGLDRPLFLIAGPCAIESRQMALDTAAELKAICAAVGVPFIYKSSFDKANRSSDKSFRGVGMDEGLDILADVKKTIGVPVLTDVHEIDQIKPIDQSRMRRFVEQHTWGAIIGTTNNQHKMDRPLVDRFDQVELPMISTEAWVKRACEIFTAEGVDHTAAVARAVVATHTGSIRDVLRAIDDYMIAKRSLSQSF
jgi:hypothetical protein